MESRQSHRRTVRHFHEPGDVHDLTFSCFRQMKLLTNDMWRMLLSQSIERATSRYRFSVVAFVFMPDHVHLLVHPRADADIEGYLAAIKRPFSYRVKQILTEQKSPLLATLTVPDKRKGSLFHFWRKGPGYDRNFRTVDAVTAAIDYIHMNPVRQGLCQHADQWKWSSARWYLSDRNVVDQDLPTIHGLPPGWFDT